MRGVRPAGPGPERKAVLVALLTGPFGLGGYRRHRDRRDALAASGQSQAVGRGARNPDRGADGGARTSCASCRRAPIRGLLPITWTLPLPMRKPASPDEPGRVRPAARRPTPRDQAGSDVPNTEPEVAEPGSRQQGVAERVGGDVGIRVARQAASRRATAGRPATSAGRPRRRARRCRCRRRGSGDGPSDGTGRPPPGQDGLGHDDVERPGDLERLLVAGDHVRPGLRAARPARHRRWPVLVEIGGGVRLLQDARAGSPEGSGWRGAGRGRSCARRRTRRRPA